VTELEAEARPASSAEREESVSADATSVTPDDP